MATITNHKPWIEGQPTVFPHAGGCPGCRAASLCNCCGAGVSSSHDRCTNGRCLRCHEDTCTGGGTERHGYGDPMKLHGPKE